jgi:RNA polymerase sigma-70 factor (ECF subfamily)
MTVLDLERLHAGDADLFEDLVRTYSPLLAPHLRRYTSPDSDVDDLLQELWLRAFRKRTTYTGRGSLLGWLLSVGRTVGMAAVSRRHQLPDATAPGASERSGALESISLREMLSDAVLALTDRQRDVVLMRLVEGLSTGETAAQLHCAEGTVKATLHQAISKLRALLVEEDK